MPVQKTCPICEKNFFVRKSQAEKIKTCSSLCKGKRLSQIRIGENSFRWKGGKEKKKCEICLKEFESFPSHKRRFCSTQCRLAWYSTYRMGKLSNSIEKKCENCGKNFWIRKSHADKRINCSLKCGAEWREKNMVGEKSNFYINGKGKEHASIRASKKYKVWRTAVYKRDNFACVLCGCNKSGELEADHIKPFSLFPELRFELSNGRTLCRDCHRKTETYGVRIWKKKINESTLDKPKDR